MAPLPPLFSQIGNLVLIFGDFLLTHNFEISPDGAFYFSWIGLFPDLHYFCQKLGKVVYLANFYFSVRVY